jgi:hypothetical protein
VFAVMSLFIPAAPTRDLSWRGLCWIGASGELSVARLIGKTRRSGMISSDTITPPVLSDSFRDGELMSLASAFAQLPESHGRSSGPVLRIFRYLGEAKRICGRTTKRSDSPPEPGQTLSSTLAQEEHHGLGFTIVDHRAARTLAGERDNPDVLPLSHATIFACNQSVSILDNPLSVHSGKLCPAWDQGSQQAG